MNQQRVCVMALPGSNSTRFGLSTTYGRELPHLARRPAGARCRKTLVIAGARTMVVSDCVRWTGLAQPYLPVPPPNPPANPALSSSAMAQIQNALLPQPLHPPGCWWQPPGRCGMQCPMRCVTLGHAALSRQSEPQPIQGIAVRIDRGTAEPRLAIGPFAVRDSPQGSQRHSVVSG